MYISNIVIENFRLFGAGDEAFKLFLKPGLTALVGENDAGKTAVIDALRFILGTRDQENLRLDVTDFHLKGNNDRASEIKIKITFSDLTVADRGTFAEYLTYIGNPPQPALIITWVARRTEATGPIRRFMPVEWRTGEKADGPLLDAGARFHLQATYLRPLRDAERAMSAGRGSRLSQILQHTKEIVDHGVGFDQKATTLPDPTTLSVLGLGDYTNHLIEGSEGIKNTRQKLNDEYLRHLSFSGDLLNARVRMSSHHDDGARLRQLLEKLEVNLSSEEILEEGYGRGLGSNNILFMACELLLLRSEAEGVPLLLIEEPEAHLHPQRQLRLMAFLQAQATKARPDGQCIQIIMTTHSPNLASGVKLDNLVLVRGGRGYSMAAEVTQLSKSDYRFLERFLDVTKANLFFARGVVIVEGDAENILLPVIARLIGRDFEHYGVSVVNVGGVGLSRYGRIFMRKNPAAEGEISIPVACITDLDVMPDCAPAILGKVKAGDPIPEIKGSGRRWRVKGDFKGAELQERRTKIVERAEGQRVRSFVANEWTLEYDLAYFGLGEKVHCAIALAAADDKINLGAETTTKVEVTAKTDFADLLKSGKNTDELSTIIYEPLASSSSVSKPVAAQYLSELLERAVADKSLTPEDLRAVLPPYVIDAIIHVTEPFIVSAAGGASAPVASADGGSIA